MYLQNHFLEISSGKLDIATHKQATTVQQMVHSNIQNSEDNLPFENGFYYKIIECSSIRTDEINICLIFISKQARCAVYQSPTSLSYIEIEREAAVVLLNV